MVMIEHWVFLPHHIYCIMIKKLRIFLYAPLHAVPEGVLHKADCFLQFAQVWIIVSFLVEDNVQVVIFPGDVNLIIPKVHGEEIHPKPLLIEGEKFLRKPININNKVVVLGVLAEHGQKMIAYFEIGTHSWYHIEIGFIHEGDVVDFFGVLLHGFDSFVEVYFSIDDVIVLIDEH